ncbi:MAG: hypothetical protein AB7V77_03380 [Candidatus Woesearchaeota archaeon]
MNANKIISIVLTVMLLLALPVSAIKNTPPAPEDFVLNDFKASSLQPSVGEEVEFSVKIYNDGYDNLYPMSYLVIDFGDGHTKTLYVGSINVHTSEEIKTTYSYIQKGNFDVKATLVVNEDNTANNEASLSLEATSTVTLTDIDDVVMALGDSFSHQVEANTDAVNSTLTYTISNQPAGMTISNTGLIQWTPTAVGVYSAINVQVKDSLNATDSDIFNIEVKNNVPRIDVIESRVVFEGDRQSSQVRTITIKNTGIEPLTNVQVSAKTTSGNEIPNTVLVVGSYKNTLAVNEEITLTLTGIIPNSSDAGIEYKYGYLTVSGVHETQTVQDTADIYFKTSSYLSIESIKLYVNGDKEDTFNSNGDSYDELKEGDEIKIVIDVEHNQDDDDAEMEDVFVELDVESNAEWDFIDEEESNEVDIEEGDNYEFEMSFTIDPDELDEDSEDSATFTVTVKGTDSETDFDHYVVWTFTLEIDREKDEITITNIEVSPYTLTCSDKQLTVSVDYKNTGSNDQDDGRIIVKSSGLDLRESYMFEDLESRDSDSRDFILNLPSDIEEGSYVLEVEAYDEDNELTDRESILIEVNCGTNEQENEEDSDSVDNNNGFNIQPINNIPTSTVFNPVAGQDDFRSGTLYLTLLIILVILALVGVILLSSIVMKKK